MIKKFLFFIFLLLNTPLFSAIFYVDVNNPIAADTLGAGYGTSFDTPFKTIQFAYLQCNNYDTIFINQGLYELKNDVSYEIVCSKIGISFIGIGDVILEGKGKFITSNNTLFIGVDGGNCYNYTFKNLTIKDFYIVFNFDNGSWMPINNFENVRLIDNYYFFYYGGDHNLVITKCEGLEIINSNIYLYQTSRIRGIDGIKNATFYKVNIIKDNAPMYELRNFENVNFVECNFGNKLYRFYEGVNNNFYNCDTFPSGINHYQLDPKLTDTRPEVMNLSLKIESPIKNLSSKKSYIGARGIGKSSNAIDTSSWSEWYSWLNENDSILLTSDTDFIIDTNGVNFIYSTNKTKRITKVFKDFGGKYGKIKNIFGVYKEYFDLNFNQYGIIDYDTTTKVREYRYIASINEITNDDLKINSGKWITKKYKEKFTTIVPAKYLAIELTINRNY